MSLAVRRSRPASAVQRPAAPAAEERRVEPPGMSYVCRRCDVYGYLKADEILTCWQCGQSDSMARR